jgi:uncharacterized protein YgbK (DUF1537 family)
MGHHFVGQQLLSDASMQHHPLNPMTNSNLVTHLQSQTRRKVGLVAHDWVRLGPEPMGVRFDELEAEGVKIAVVDCISAEDMQSICQASSGLKLISGSSAPAQHLPISWRNRTVLSPEVQERDGRGFLVVAGSYSEATARQKDWLRKEQTIVVTLEALKLAIDGVASRVVSTVCDALRARSICLVQVSRDKEQVVRYFQQCGETELQAGERISRGLAQFVQAIISEERPEGLIVAGGETSSAISRALGFGALLVGPNIEPGVPVCLPLGGRWTQFVSW